MPVSNVVDHRTNKYNVEVDVVFEPSCHDNSINGATQFKWEEEFLVKELYNTTVEEAIKYINSKYEHQAVTIFVYDYGSKPVG